MKKGLGGHGIADIAKCLVALLSEFKRCLEEKDYLQKKSFKFTAKCVTRSKIKELAQRHE